jgi:pSer/pThr/pTyr-binding forkhead associated (FHA) protein
MERPGGFSSGGAGLWLEWDAAGSRSRLPLTRPLTIGRDPASDVCLTDPSVSRHHAVVSMVSGRPHVDASTSTNGIALDQGRTNRATLSPGQPFRIGEITFRVVGMPAAQPALSRPAAVVPAIAAMPGAGTGGLSGRPGGMSGQVIVRVYKGGNQSQAAQKFAEDAAQLAAQGYVPISQSWAQNERGGCMGCLMLVIFWPLLLLGKGGGTLTVTYRYDPTRV